MLKHITLLSNTAPLQVLHVDFKVLLLSRWITMQIFLRELDRAGIRDKIPKH